MTLSIKTARLPAALAAAAVLLLGCPGGPEPILDCPADAGSPPPVLQDVYDELQGPICSGCHFPGGTMPDQSTPAALAALIGAESLRYAPVHILSPGNLRDSAMYLKVMGGKAEGYAGPNGEDVGQRMPAGLDPLTEPQRDLLRRWICAGTPQ